MRRKAFADGNGLIATVALFTIVVGLVPCAPAVSAAAGPLGQVFAQTRRRSGPAERLLAALPQEASTDGCRDYRNHLERARSYLERGDRAGALAELRRARAALQSCRHSDGEGVVATA